MSCDDTHVEGIYSPSLYFIVNFSPNAIAGAFGRVMECGANQEPRPLVASASVLAYRHAEMPRDGRQGTATGLGPAPRSVSILALKFA